MDERNVILIVDDMEINRAILCQMFENRYQVVEAEDGQQALALIAQYKQQLAIVLLDIVMPGLDGFGVLESMQRDGLLGHIPVILITGDSSSETAGRGYDFGTADVITKPFDASVVLRRVENVIELYRHKNRLEDLVEEQTQKLAEQNRRLKEFDSFLIDTLSTVVEFRSLESGQHVLRIRTFTKVLLRYVARMYPEYQLTDELIDVISSASALHDVGKIAIPDAILLKPGRLTAEEFDIMKTHSLKGCEILESIGYIQDQIYYQYSYDICRHHHERWDGRGYPDGLKGDEIPLCAQVVSVADVYDALVSERCYKAAYPPEEALRMILGGECGAFSPRLMECLKLAKDEMAALVGNEVVVDV